MKNKKGFTLIELLAVIVILAVIMVIAVPKILDVIDESRMQAFGESTSLMVDAVRLKKGNNMLNGINNHEATYTFEDGEDKSNPKLNVKGELPDNGIIKVDKDGKVALALLSRNKKYCATKTFTGKVEVKRSEDGVCQVSDEIKATVPDSFIKDYTVTFNDDGTITKVTVKSNKTVVEKTPKGKTNYAFKHWSKTENGSAYNFNTKVTSNFTLYAVYELATVTITFNSNGGSEVQSISEMPGTTITLPTPTKEGYNFDGWYTGSTGGTKITSTTMPDSDKTYYAHWKGPYAVYTLGSSVKYDPVSNAKCTSGSTCYNWSVITVGDKDINSNIKLQMDHNIVNVSAWAPTNTSSGPTTALSALETATSGWNNALKLTYSYNTSAATSNYGTLSCTNGTCTISKTGATITSNLKARMITGEEITAIAKSIGAGKSTNAYSWTVASSYNNYYYFSNTQYNFGTHTGGSGFTILSWLIKNTSSNSQSGATRNSYGGINTGYWTLSPISDYASIAWGVTSEGNLTTGGSVSNTSNCGIRPVIEIPKSALK